MHERSFSTAEAFVEETFAFWREARGSPLVDR